MKKNAAKANTKTNGSEMASLDFSTQDGPLNVSDLSKPIVLTIKKNPDVPVVQLEEMDPNNYGEWLKLFGTDNLYWVNTFC